MRYRPSDLAANRGYSPEGVEALAYSLGDETPPDMFEAFNIGREVAPPGVPPDVIASYYAPNLWPVEPEEMRETWLEYWVALEQLGLVLTDIFARALGLPSGWFRPLLDRSISVLRANNYQRRGTAEPVQPGQLRMGAHSDYTTYTLLLADPVPGLQIVGADGGWVDVVPQPGNLPMNVGDLLAMWTNDTWPSTLHRVVPMALGAADRRRSVAWFHYPDPDVVVAPLPAFAGDAPRYEPVRVDDHVRGKLGAPKTGEAPTSASTAADRPV